MPAAQIDELKARAAEVTGIAARGKPIDVALAANRAFELVPDLCAVYADRVPAQVIRLGYLESEARLQALAGDRGRAADAVGGLGVVWKELRKKVRRAAPAATRPRMHFDAHVRAMRNLVDADASAGRSRARRSGAAASSARSKRATRAERGRRARRARSPTSPS